MRKLPIQSISPDSGTITVPGDFRQVFQGKFYRDSTGQNTSPAYTVPPPAGYTLIRATTFDIVSNVKYAGRYTVYTPVSSTDLESSTYDGTNTVVKVNEVIAAIGDDDVSLLTSGYVTNISTYLLDTGTATVIVPPVTNTDNKYPVEFIGRDSIGWGEVFNQNFLNVAKTFAGENPPDGAFLGQLYYNTLDKQVRAYNGSAWELLNVASFGTTYRHTQSDPSAQWTVNHYLNLQQPYVAFVQFFVDRGDGPKMIIPSDVSFDSKDTLTVTFTNAEIGYVLVRP